ncbi:MAG: hypothetical protein ABIS36_12090 [Chryseolinea sp.]
MLAVEKGTPYLVCNCIGVRAGEYIIAIPGTKRIKYPEENIVSEDVLHEPLQNIESVMPAGIVS